MKRDSLPANASPEGMDAAAKSSNSHSQSVVQRRSFLKGVGMAGVALSAGAVWPDNCGRMTLLIPTRVAV
jgi:hypothetical protein